VLITSTTNVAVDGEGLAVCVCVCVCVHACVCMHACTHDALLPITTAAGVFTTLIERGLGPHCVRVGCMKRISKKVLCRTVTENGNVNAAGT